MTICTRVSHRNVRLTASALLFAALAFSFVPASPVRAATVTVTDQTDTTNAACAADGTTTPCSLRDAVTYANANAGTTISVLAGTYNLTGGELVLSADMTITGAGAGSTFVQRQGNTSFRIVHQTAGTATITGLTLRYGFAGGGSNGGAVYAAGTALTLNSSTISDNGADYGGGGIYVNSGTTVTLNDCTVSNNQQQTGSSTDGGGGIRNKGTLNVNRTAFSGNSSAKNGGAIYNSYQSGGAVTIANSTFSGNVSTNGAGGGGAIAQQGSGMTTITNSTFNGTNHASSGGALFTMAGVTITNSTFSGNCADGGAGNGGGAIYNSGGGGPITNSTFSGNSATSGSGGALYSDSGLTLIHVTFSGNTASAAPATNEFRANGITLKNSIVNGACTASGAGVTSQDYNLASGSGCWTTKAHDLLNTNPNLGPLQDNGGPTFTMAITRTSPAFEKIPSSGANCAATDQRGIVRPQPANGLCDIGAFEVVVLDAASLDVTGFPSPQTAGVAGSVTVTARDTEGNVALGYTGTIHFASTDPQAVLPGDYTFVAGDQGVHAFPVTFETAGTQSITVKDAADAAIMGTQSAITINAAAATVLTVAGHATSVVAGTPGTVVVTIRDAYGNLATDYTGTVRFSSSDAQATKPADYTFTAGSGLDNGTHTFTNGIMLKTAGTQSISATDTAMGTITGSQTGITVNPATSSRLVVSGYPSPVNAGMVNAVTITASDIYGNTTTDYTGTVHVTSSDPAAVLPANYAFTAGDAGVHPLNAAFNTSGTQSITVTDTGTSSVTGSQSGIIVKPTITSIDPASGSVNGGSAVTLIGTGYAPGATVTFGGLTATVTNATNTTITVTAPSHPAAGSVNVVVTVNGQQVTLPGGYTYDVTSPLPPAQPSLPVTGSPDPLPSAPRPSGPTLGPGTPTPAPLPPQR
jgi:predicted outer membrane repeat protein